MLVPVKEEDKTFPPAHKAVANPLKEIGTIQSIVRLPDWFIVNFNLLIVEFDLRFKIFLSRRNVRPPRPRLPATVQ